MQRLGVRSSELCGGRRFGQNLPALGITCVTWLCVSKNREVVSLL